MRLSIVVPCYNEAANIDELYRQLDHVAARIEGLVEFVFVDDGSRDATCEKLKELAVKDARPRDQLLAQLRAPGGPVRGHGLCHR
jgi:dolichol-phosphate mannosyltransferase